MLRRILIANRGEIAVRLLRSCHRLGIETVLAASDADLDSMPARMADQVIRLGPGPAATSYLDVGSVVGAAVAAGVQGIHPGYGFLSENARLARACRDAGLVFVGPTAEQLDAVGDKLLARSHAAAAGLPLLPGGEVSSSPQALQHAEEIGWPLLIKAVAGGGGRGLRVVESAAGLRAAVDEATAEARAAFGDGRLYLERFVRRGRHVEVQLLGDGRQVIHLGDRDCSVQRRYQKLVEEAPAPDLPDGLRTRLHAAAVALGRHLAYLGLGTVEFLVDADRREAFWFLEMNARIQVEHPVTEAISGLDLVAEQLRVADGHPLALAQGDIALTGHALECRVNAEDPGDRFRPSPGTVTDVAFPAGPGIRVDSHLQPGSTVPPFYDALLAKVIGHGRDRAEAVRLLRSALGRTRLDGATTNLALHQDLLADPEFATGGVDTGYLSRYLERNAIGLAVSHA